MAKRSTLAKSELEIAKIVWDLGEATVRQVADAVPADRELDFWTVQTYLRRLAAKGYLRTRRKGRNNLYSASVRPRTVVHEVVEDLIGRLFNGRAVSLFQHLIDERGLSEGEIEELQNSLNQMKARKKGTTK